MHARAYEPSCMPSRWLIARNAARRCCSSIASCPKAPRLETIESKLTRSPACAATNFSNAATDSSTSRSTSAGTLSCAGALHEPLERRAPGHLAGDGDDLGGSGDPDDLRAEPRVQVQRPAQVRRRFYRRRNGFYASGERRAHSLQHGRERRDKRRTTGPLAGVSRMLIGRRPDQVRSSHAPRRDSRGSSCSSPAPSGGGGRVFEAGGGPRAWNL